MVIERLQRVHVRQEPYARLSEWHRRVLALLDIRRLSLARQFLLVSLAVLVTGTLVIGAWAARQLEEGVLHRTAGVTALYVDSMVAPHLQSLATSPMLADSEVAALDQLLAETPLGERIVAFKVWSPDGTVRYSPNRVLIGRQFAVEEYLSRAVRGELTAELSNLDRTENEFEREQWHTLLEVYVPVREDGTGRVIAVTEFYQRPDEIEADTARVQRRSWTVVAGVMLAMYGALALVVKRGSNTITRQQRALGEQVTELSTLLRQNARLHERVRQAAERTTTLNEQALRRIGADLHDGPGQALALALLRLDPPPEDDESTAPSMPVDSALIVPGLRDALAEMRAIAAGLRLPELEGMTLPEIVDRLVREHERRTGSLIAVTRQEAPVTAPLAVKIALYRSLQEALSNATRHAGGRDVRVEVWEDEGKLCLSVADRGPGFVTARRSSDDGRLGLAGIRERAQLLGGSFAVESVPGDGTTLRVCWPLLPSVEPEMMS